ncbi:MAG: molybdopterin-dependent oxidoreductase, partial [Anaerolineales bacterium]
ELNGEKFEISPRPGENLMQALRRHEIWSVKHGCETGECGACSVLMDGALVPTCVLPAEAAEGKHIETVEGLSARHELDPIQRAFVETGAIQCGYCTPAMILATQELLEETDNPTEEQCRQALSGVLCRCTGYVKPIEAMLRAAAYKRGEQLTPYDSEGIPLPLEFFDWPVEEQDSSPPGGGGTQTETQVETRKPLTDASESTKIVAHPKPKVDAVKLVKGRPVFADDIDLPGMLHAAMLTSPHAHARIRDIDVSEALAMPGVEAVLTYKDVPRVIYASGGQSYPNPHPWDQVSLDNKVRHVGDRVAVVAAETAELAWKALDRISVDYEVLPAVFTPEDAMAEGAPIIHDEEDAVGIEDAERNLAVRMETSVGDVEKALAESDHVYERTYKVHQVQQSSIEPHIVVTYWDEDDRLVIRTSTQVPFHVRRMVAPLLGLEPRQIRVVKPRLGGGFGGKQEMLIEDLCAHLTLATDRPVRFEYTREQEFTSARSRHPQTLKYRAGVSSDGKLNALDLHVIEDSGAFGTHGMTVCGVTGLRGLATYKCDDLRFVGEIVYTNRPTPGAFRGYGAPQAEFALESLMEEIAKDLALDSVEFRMQNSLEVGDPIAITASLGEGDHITAQTVHSTALAECVSQGAAAIRWDRKQDPDWRIDPERPHIRRGLGFAVAMHGTAIAGLDMGAASLKMNDDGSFNLLVGATDLGTGSDTVLAQIAAETLGVPLEDVIIYSSDTDFTPFDTGAYASSTTYISGGAVMKAAEQVRDQIFERAALMLEMDKESMYLSERHVLAPGGKSVSLEEIALSSLHEQDQRQIMATASHVSDVSPPPFAAQFAEIELDIETGAVEVKDLVMAVDCGTPINPQTATGQVEGGLAQALGYAVSEEMAYDESGRVINTRFGDYRIFQADEMPKITAILVPSYEPNGPYGAKAVAEIPMDGVAPAVANAIDHACGLRIRELPFTPDRVWKQLAKAGVGSE